MKKKLISFYLLYLRIFAKMQLKKINPVIIGIGGATGKTSLAEISYQILKSKYIVKQGKGLNSETGIPLNILGIEMNSYNFQDWIKLLLLAPIKLLTNWEKYDLFIVEMGINSPIPPKNMSYLLNIINPNISILTNIQIEHSQFFDELVTEVDLGDRKNKLLDLISDQEKLLITSISKSGRVIVNLDDEKIKNSLPVNAKTLTVSRMDKNADFYIKKIEIKKDLFKVNFAFLNEEYNIKIKQALPEYFSHLLVFSIAIAFSNEISVKETIRLLETNLKLPPGRFSVFNGKNNSLIIDSTYNSSLEAVIGAIGVIDEIGKEGRKIGILGDMRELGKISRYQHELLAKEIIKKLDFVILIGDQINKYSAPILEKANFKFESYRNFTEAKKYIVNLPEKNDYILIKASQDTLLLERAVELLLENKEDIDNLCRRSEYWDEIRKNTS